MSEWQPIETAPKDEWILVFGTHTRSLCPVLTVRWDGDEWQSGDDGYRPYVVPTHWMPLPEPPHA